jgi:hypothetical protein
MNNLNSGENMNTMDKVEAIDQGVTSPAVHSDPFTDKAQADSANNPIAPMDGTVVSNSTMDEPIAYHEVPLGRIVALETPEKSNTGILALLDREESEQLRARWNEIQGMFVDDPRSAVQQADALVSEVVKKIIKIFASEHSSLEGQWNQGIDVSTEDLRKALQHYRSFFNRLVV